MDQGRLIKLIFDADAELPSDRRHDAGRAVGLANPKPEAGFPFTSIVRLCARSTLTGAEVSAERGAVWPTAGRAAAASAEINTARRDSMAGSPCRNGGPMVLFAIYGLP